MGVYNELDITNIINNSAILGNCIYDNIRIGNLNFNSSDISLAYVLEAILISSCDNITNRDILVSKYNSIVNKCNVRTITTITVTEVQLLLEDGNTLLTESSGNFLLE